jgi:hypothetical protein
VGLIEHVYVVQRHCDDYYCGCGGGHIAGIYLSDAEAQDAATAPYSTMRVTKIRVGEQRWDVEHWRVYDRPIGWT